MAEITVGKLMGAAGGGAMAGEIVWITGASSGIGRALALQMAAAGARVVATARNATELQQLAALNPEIYPLPADVTDVAALAAVGDRLRQMVPHLNRVILNAGTCEYFDIATPDWAMMERVMRVNFLGAVNSLSVALPLLRLCPDGSGHIVAVASMATELPFSRAQAYGASKAALRYFADALRTDLQREGVDVTVINPGFVKTPLTDKNDFAMPFLLPVEQAAARMLAAIVRRRRRYDFPRRLYCLLKLLGWWPALWYRVVAPRLQRT